jgi:hypothetical protein
MSAGSGASNLGYANIAPLSNINGSYVNVDNSQYAGRFGSNEIPGTPPGPLPGLAGAKSNVDAAAGIVPGICLFKGGAKKLKRKIKNITKHYKRMKAGSKKIHRLKTMLRKRAASRTLARKLAGGRKRNYSRKISRSLTGGRRRRQRGGYSQYQNNMPMTPTYQVAGINLPASQLGLANPPPIKVLCNDTNCIDNYSHFPPPSGYGFPSKGH